MASLLPLLVAIPMGIAFLIVGISHLKKIKATVTPLAVVAVATCLALSIILLWSGPLNHYVGQWGPEGKGVLGIELVCDGLTKLMLIIINLVALVSVIFAAAYMKRFTKVWLFNALFLLMTAAMNAVVLAGDLFNLFVFIEVAAISSYALVGFGCESEELEASFKYLVLGTIGSAFILLGVAILYALTGHLNMAEVSKAIPLVGAGNPAVLLAVAALLGGVAVKAAMVPFHAWLPDAHPSAPAPISAMLSGVLIKAAGVYVLMRVVFNVLGPTPALATVLMVMGGASMVVGAFMMIGQGDLKRLLAYSSISHMGFVVLAVGVAAEVLATGGNKNIAGLCLLGGLFHLFNHAAFKSLLFLSSGAIEQSTGTRQLSEMGGLSQKMKITSFCVRVGALSISGVPPFSGFFSKLIIIIALAMAGHPVLSGLAVLVAVVTLLSFIKVQRYVLEGEPSEKVAGAREAPALMCVALIVLAIVCMIAGAAFIPPFSDVLLGPAKEALMETTRSITMGVGP